jgi:hypothetical protein
MRLKIVNSFAVMLSVMDLQVLCVDIAVLTESTVIPSILLCKVRVLLCSIAVSSFHMPGEVLLQTESLITSMALEFLLRILFLSFQQWIIINNGFSLGHLNLGISHGISQHFCSPVTEDTEQRHALYN